MLRLCKDLGCELEMMDVVEPESEKVVPVQRTRYYEGMSLLSDNMTDSTRSLQRMGRNTYKEDNRGCLSVIERYPVLCE